MQFALFTAVVALAVLVGSAAGETHTVHLQNNCRDGTPTLVVGNPSQGLSADADLVFNGPLTDAIAFLQTGACGPAGENCTVVRLSLVNGDESGAQSAVGIDLSYPYAFSTATTFRFSNGCDTSGAYCGFEGCSAADAVVQCKANDVDLTVAWCLLGDA